jgi:hypothetical protein
MIEDGSGVATRKEHNVQRFDDYKRVRQWGLRHWAQGCGTYGLGVRDKQIIERVAAMGKVKPSWAEQADEHAMHTMS